MTTTQEQQAVALDAIEEATGVRLDVERITQQGRGDAEAFFAEHREDAETALKSSTEPDEALLDAMGREAVEELWGIEWEVAGHEACAVYNAAWRARLAELTSTFALRDEGGVTRLEATDLDTAIEEARALTEAGEWGPGAGSTIWVHYDVVDGAGRCVHSGTVALDPEEPECEAGYEHDWVSPHWLLGGDKWNPGVQGNGGGTITTEACRHCGCQRVTDTWAQDPSSGRQGLTSVCYSKREYVADFRTRGKEEATESDLESESEVEAWLADKGALYSDAYRTTMERRRAETEEQQS